MSFAHQKSDAAFKLSLCFMQRKTFFSDRKCALICNSYGNSISMPNKAKSVQRIYQNNFAVTYHKVASITSHLVATSQDSQTSIKGIFIVYLLLPFGEKFIFAIIARSTIHDSTKTEQLLKWHKNSSNPFEMINTLYDNLQQLLGYSYFWFLEKVVLSKIRVNQVS